MSYLWSLQTNDKASEKKGQFSTSNLHTHLWIHHPSKHAATSLSHISQTQTQSASVSSTPTSSVGSSADTPVSSSSSQVRRILSGGQQQLITDWVRRMTKYGKDSIKYKRITNKITMMLAKLMLPFSLVDEEEFPGSSYRAGPMLCFTKQKILV